MITGMPRVSGSCLSRRHTSHPLSCGTMMSSRMTSGLLARALEGVGAIPDQGHVVAFLGQVVADELGHVLLVLDHEDAAARFGRFRWSGLRGAPPCRHRRVGLPHGSCRHGGSVATAGYSPMTAP